MTTLEEPTADDDPRGLPPLSAAVRAVADPRLDRLTKHLGGATVWAKREDCNSGYAFGGNKTRKLEYLVPTRSPRAATRSSRSVASSRTTRGRSRRGRRGGPEVRARPGELGRLARRHVRPRRQHPAIRLMGADVRLVKAGFGIGFKESWEQALAEIEGARRQAVRDPGGSVRSPARRPRVRLVGREVEAQEAELGVFFDTIIVCSVTGSTQAGMIAGFADRARERRVIGIDASAKPAETWAQVARIARFTAKSIGVERELRDDEIILDDRYHAGTYGIPDESTLAAMRLAARLEAMITDPVYEGKSMAGLIDLVVTRDWSDPSSVSGSKTSSTQPTCSNEPPSRTYTPTIVSKSLPAESTVTSPPVP